eukprot:gene4325-7681_t
MNTLLLVLLFICQFVFGQYMVTDTYITSRSCGGERVIGSANLLGACYPQDDNTDQKYTCNSTHSTYHRCSKNCRMCKPIMSRRLGCIPSDPHTAKLYCGALEHAVKQKGFVMNFYRDVCRGTPQKHLYYDETCYPYTSNLNYFKILDSKNPPGSFRAVFENGVANIILYKENTCGGPIISHEKYETKKCYVSRGKESVFQIEK